MSRQCIHKNGHSINIHVDGTDRQTDIITLCTCWLRVNNCTIKTAEKQNTVQCQKQGVLATVSAAGSVADSVAVLSFFSFLVNVDL